MWTAFCLVRKPTKGYKGGAANKSARLDEANPLPGRFMALTAPSQVYDFTSNAAAGLPVPGDRVDAQFLNHKNAILTTQAALLGVIRTDGALKNGSVGVDQLDAGLIAALTDDLTASIAAAEASFFTARDDAAQSRLDAMAAAAQAVAKAADTVASASQALSSQNSAATSATAAANSLTACTNAIANFTTLLTNSLNTIDGHAADTLNHANLTQAWAEHMPDTIPPDVLAVMGITGDHWSARWWANYAAEQVQAAQDALASINASVALAQTYATNSANSATASASSALASANSASASAASAAAASGVVNNLNAINFFLDWGQVTELPGAAPLDYGALT